MRKILASVSGTACAILLTVTAAHAQQPGNDHLVSPDRLAQVSEHVWVIKGFPNIGIVVGTRATLVIDTGMGTRNGKTAADVALRLSPKGQKLYLTTTHYHAEHAAGDGGFPPGTVVIRPQVQQAELEAEGQKLVDFFSNRSPQDKELLQDYRIRPANILFDRAYALDLGGGVKVRLLWFGAAHTKGDELILAEPDGVLFSGDVVQNKTGPYFYCSQCSPRTWLGVLDQAAELQPRIVVPDHSEPGDASLIASERAFMGDLLARAKALKDEGKSLEDAKRIVTSEIQAKYQGWTALGRIGDGVEKLYADQGGP